MTKGEILKGVAVNEICAPIQKLSQPLLRYICHNEMPCFASWLRNTSVVGAFRPPMANFYCQGVHLIFSLKFPFLYFFPLLLIMKRNNFPLPPFGLTIFQIFVNCYHTLSLGIILSNRRLLSAHLSQRFSDIAVFMSELLFHILHFW